MTEKPEPAVGKSNSKPGLIIVYTGDGKGKTSAALGLCARALGAGWRVAFVQFIKAWTVNEHRFLAKISPLFNSKIQLPSENPIDGFTGDKLTFYKGGLGFFDAGKDSARDASGKPITGARHRAAAHRTFDFALDAASSGDYDLIILDEICNAVNDRLLTADDLKKLIERRNKPTSLCLTGRGWPAQLNDNADIITNMTKVKHCYDAGILAKSGIDY
ncbi:MAG: cob(I)yrinic acid a,c-diamide adenosyltransferase [Candidatus Nomurabacteria bacterium]|jgi:cob(I)alamin adenosyltransferase|nr:cob(I)yrinic acid a,c-diamide adenosyltransferase [Candidatus Nomurabacteria bacterium]